eukprot:TRINITY_DN4837_c0_g1_i1.p1 TRINITY_DN4837_c0_g1~~TRINITY_DN4837_c0_g1_i1.p1  ORF type:complete len:178 (-),score=20.32 TRINITY_DN4837_c0_g1_i1:260-793(-)
MSAGDPLVRRLVADAAKVYGLVVLGLRQRFGLEVVWTRRGTPAQVVALSTDNLTVVFQLAKMGGMSPALRFLLEDWAALKACVGLTKLRRALRPFMCNFLTIENDGLSASVVNPLRSPVASVSLSEFLYTTYHRVVPARRELRLLDWNAELSDEQLRECALRSYWCLRLSHVFDTHW